MTTDKVPPCPTINRCYLNHFDVNPQTLCCKLDHSCPNDEGIDEGENMSEHQNDPVDVEAQEEAEDGQAE